MCRQAIASDCFVDGTKEKNAQIVLTEDALSSFELVKKELSSISSLAHPVLDAPLSLTVDAFYSAIVSVLQQVVKGITQPLAFFSCQLKPTATAHSIVSI